MEVSKTITISGTELAPKLELDAKVGAQSQAADLFQVFCMSCVGDSPQDEHYCSRGKTCENGQRFSGVAKLSWVQTVGGVHFVFNRYRLRHRSVPNQHQYN